LYVQIIALLCCVHHNFITNLKPGLGVYWGIYIPADYMDYTLAVI